MMEGHKADREGRPWPADAHVKTSPDALGARESPLGRNRRPRVGGGSGYYSRTVEESVNSQGLGRGPAK